jgi:hypothetical protein
VDNAPYTGDLDLGAVATRGELIALLQTVYARADRPSLRTLEARTRHGTTPLSRTPVSEMLRGTRFPHKAVMIGFLRACGVPDEGMEPWQRAWERVVSGEEEPARSQVTQTVPGQLPTEITASVDPAEVDRLREQVNRLTEANEQLLAQLAASERQAAEELRPDETTGRQETPGALARQGTSSSGRARSIWHFPDGSRVTLVSSRLPADRRHRPGRRRPLGRQPPGRGGHRGASGPVTTQNPPPRGRMVSRSGSARDTGGCPFGQPGTVAAHGAPAVHRAIIGSHIAAAPGDV